jgi:hypothetical protein
MESLSRFHPNLNTLIAISLNLNNEIETSLQKITDIVIVNSEINEKTIFAFDESLKSVFEGFRKSRGGLFVKNGGIVALGALLVAVSVGLLASYLAFHDRSETKTANFLLLFFDIPRKEVRLIHKKATNFLSFSKVRSSELLKQSGGL